MKKNTKNCNILGSKTPKNYPLTLNYGLCSSFITLNTSKRGLGPLTKPRARLTLPVYPVFQDKIKWVTRKIGQAKNRKKRPTGLIIATNLVLEQLKKLRTTFGRIIIKQPASGWSGAELLDLAGGGRKIGGFQQLEGWLSEWAVVWCVLQGRRG